MQQYGTDINEFALRKIAEFIFKVGVEEGWDEYVETVNNMELERLLDVQQAVYDRLKERLGGRYVGSVRPAAYVSFKARDR